MDWYDPSAIDADEDDTDEASKAVRMNQRSVQCTTLSSQRVMHAVSLQWPIINGQ
jgi:hypothetical protein